MDGATGDADALLDASCIKECPEIVQERRRAHRVVAIGLVALCCAGLLQVM